MRHVTEYAPDKPGEYPSDIPQFSCYEKYLKDNKHNSLHLTLKHIRMFVLGHYLFFEARGTFHGKPFKSVA
jgi:hypothetical protein